MSLRRFHKERRMLKQKDIWIFKERNKLVWKNDGLWCPHFLATKFPSQKLKICKIFGPDVTIPCLSSWPYVSVFFCSSDCTVDGSFLWLSYSDYGLLSLLYLFSHSISISVVHLSSGLGSSTPVSDRFSQLTDPLPTYPMVDPLFVYFLRRCLFSSSSKLIPFIIYLGWGQYFFLPNFQPQRLDIKLGES